MKGDVAACRHNAGSAAAEIALKGFHPNVIAHQPAVEADPFADDILNDRRRHASRALGIPHIVDHVRHHPLDRC